MSHPSQGFFATGVLALVISAVFFVLAGAGKQDIEAEDRFFIEVTHNEEGVELVCRTGCAWEQLSWSCDGQRDCKRSVNFYGMTAPNRD